MGRTMQLRLRLYHNTMGGVAVNGNVEVVDKDYNPIPGLFAVGMDSMGAILDGVGYPNFGGPATSWCLNSGRIAASEASKYLKKLRS